MNECEECGAELKQFKDSEYLVCTNCGLVSNVRIFSFPIRKKEESKPRKGIKIYSISEKLIRKIKIAEKFERKINDEILHAIRTKAWEIKDYRELREFFYSRLYKAAEDDFVKEAIKYRNIAKVFLNGNGSEIIFDAVSLLYYSKKKGVEISYEKAAEIFNIAKNNLFRRYKEFERRIKIYEKIGLRRLILLKMLNQPKLRNLSLKEIALIAGVRHDSARAAYSRLRKSIGFIVDEKVILGKLIGHHRGLQEGSSSAGGGI